MWGPLAVGKGREMGFPLQLRKECNPGDTSETCVGFQTHRAVSYRNECLLSRSLWLLLLQQQQKSLGFVTHSGVSTAHCILSNFTMSSAHYVSKQRGKISRGFRILGVGCYYSKYLRMWKWFWNWAMSRCVRNFEERDRKSRHCLEQNGVSSLDVHDW